MTLKDFLQDKTLTAVEIAEEFNLIFNVYIEGVGYGLSIDTSNIPSGTKLFIREDFTLENDILSVAGISLDTATTNMLQ
jgi:hypothetical protein